MKSDKDITKIKRVTFFYSVEVLETEKDHGMGKGRSDVVKFIENPGSHQGVILVHLQTLDTCSSWETHAKIEASRRCTPWAF